MQSVNLNLPEVFLESSKNFSGTKTKGKRKILNTTLERRAAEKTIFKLASDTNTPISTVVTKILIQSVPELQKYVLSHNEKPELNPLKLATQAIIIRANEIGTISKALDTDDNDSLLQIEGAEAEAVNNANPDAKSILPTDVQAAIKIVLDRVAAKSASYKKSGKMQDFIKAFKQPNGFDLNTAAALSMPDTFDLGTIDPNYGQQWIEGNVTNPPETSGSNDIFSIFDKIVDGISRVAGSVGDAVGSAKDALTNLLGGVKDSASDIGADSIQKALKDYLPYIIGGVVLFTLIIVITIYASKRK